MASGYKGNFGRLRADRLQSNSIRNICVVDALSNYSGHDEPLPRGVRCHSLRPAVYFAVWYLAMNTVCAGSAMNAEERLD